jgi:DNA repair protein RecO (recombination protein O)
LEVAAVRYYKSEGLVLGHHDLGDADRIVTVLTPEEGKVGAVAKGARRPQSKLAASVQPLTQGRFMFYRGRGLDAITQAEVVHSFRPLLHDLDRLTYAAYTAELAGEVARERDPAQELYRLLLATWEALATAEFSVLEVIARRFELGLLQAAGYCPTLDGCTGCGKLPGPFLFSAEAGGLVCPACAGAPKGIEVDEGTIASMKAMLRLPPGRVRVLKLSEAAARRIGSCLEACIVYRLERRPRALAALAELRRLREE